MSRTYTVPGAGQSAALTHTFDEAREAWKSKASEEHVYGERGAAERREQDGKAHDRFGHYRRDGEDEADEEVEADAQRAKGGGREPRLGPLLEMDDKEPA